MASWVTEAKQLIARIPTHCRQIKCWIFQASKAAKARNLWRSTRITMSAPEITESKSVKRKLSLLTWSCTRTKWRTSRSVFSPVTSGLWSPIKSRLRRNTTPTPPPIKLLQNQRQNTAVSKITWNTWKCALTNLSSQSKMFTTKWIRRGRR